MPPSAGPEALDARYLRAHPLPPLEGGDKEARGRVVVIGGSALTPGAVILAGLAALRAGGGKLRIATAASVAGHVAAAVPEALVVPLPEVAGGALGAASALALDGIEDDAAVLLGPGLIDPEATDALVRAVLGGADDLPLVIDAGALHAVAADPALLRRHPDAALTPNRAELEALAAASEGDDAELTARAVARLGVAVAGAGCVASPTSPLAATSAGGPGLGTSGSGDVRAGAIAGLRARGAPPAVALAWGVHAHRVAGERLAARVAPIGYLARELLDELPGTLADLAGGDGVAVA